MDANSVTLITFICCLAGFTLGAVIGRILPPDDLKENSREVLKDATAMIATLVALVLGLLVSSAKATFDKSADKVNESGAKIIELDRLLRHYGPESDPAREHLRRYLRVTIGRLEKYESKSDVPESVSKLSVDDVMNRPVRNLKPENDEQKEIKEHVMEAVRGLADDRWMLIAQSFNPLPNIFLLLMFFWLVVLFAGFGILSPRNRTVGGALVVCALSMAGAVYLIMEMNRPLDGSFRVPSTPLKIALDLMNEE